jgi:5'-nucleotidase
MPFPNHVIGLEVKGKVIKRFLENAVSRYEQNSGRFLQISGLEVGYNILRPAGDRVVNVTLQGEEVNPERVYKIALPEFLANGGDGYDMFSFAQRYRHDAESKFVLEVLRDYLRARSPLEPRVDGRISFLN